MKYDAVIFDLDGVICYTDEYHYQAWKAMADELGAYFDREINNRLRGVSRMASLEIVLETYDGELSQAEKEVLAEEKNERYKALLANMSPADLSDEVKRTLDTLRTRGYLLAIGSSSKNAPFILRQIGLEGYFIPSPTPRSSSRLRRCWASSRSAAWWWRTPFPAQRPRTAAA